MQQPEGLYRTYTVDGFRFTWNGDSYEARGQEVRDDYGDRRPENRLLDAAKKLVDNFQHGGGMYVGSWDWDFGEKGWVYVFQI